MPRVHPAPPFPITPLTVELNVDVSTVEFGPIEEEWTFVLTAIQVNWAPGADPGGAFVKAGLGPYPDTKFFMTVEVAAFGTAFSESYGLGFSDYGVVMAPGDLVYLTSNIVDDSIATLTLCGYAMQGTPPFVRALP